MMDLVVLREFGSRGDAEIVRELLVANGVEARLTSDDCGSVDPALAFGRGVQLLVAGSDLDRARRIVSEAESGRIA